MKPDIGPIPIVMHGLGAGYRPFPMALLIMARTPMVKRENLWDLHFPQLTECIDDGSRQLMNAAKIVELPAHYLLFHPGASCRNYLLLLSGTVHTRMLNESGREFFLYQVCAGESCILTTSCLFGGSSYPAEGITVEEVTAFSIAVAHQMVPQIR